MDYIKNYIMKKTILFLAGILFYLGTMSQAVELRGVTFGIGTGFSYVPKPIYSYSLSPDESNSLKLQKVGKLGFVISSMITIKFGRLALEQESLATSKRERLTNSNNLAPVGSTTTYEKAKWWNRLALNVGLNMIEANSDNIDFNKNIDGGVGIGYFINEFTQLAAFFDVARVKQLRDHIVNDYENKPIPNGAEYYNALDESDDKLFHNKVFTGFSLKVVFSLGNRK